MAEQITSDNFERYFIQTQESLVDSLEQSNGQVDIALITDLNTIKEILSLPGVKYDKDPTTESDAKAVNYVQIPYKVLATAIEQANAAAQSATSAAGSVQTAIDDAEQATSDANTATSNANQAASNANQKASDANSAASAANSAASNANEKASDANTAAGAANTAAQNANTKAGLADTAATNANEKATLANNAATSANNAATAANTAATGAERVNAILSQQSGAVILTVTSRNGSSTSKEVGFRIAKTYSSVAAMKADAANIEDGRFTLIASNVEDPDNAKLYVRASDQQTTEPKGFSFLTDLSGAQGIKGDTPVMTADSEGVIYADGTKLTEVLKNAVATFLANEGTSSSAAGSSTRWGQYKSAEASRNSQYSTAESNRNSQYSTAESSRDSQYSTAEGNRDTSYQSAEDARDTARLNAEGTSSSTANDGTRWGAYKYAEAARNTSYGTAEGSSTSTAGDGSRWGTFKSNETQRQSNFDTAQTNRNTTWTNWFSDTLTTGVRKIWNTWYNNVTSAWDTWFGTSSSTGVQGTWNTWFGTNDTEGVQKDWKDLRTDVVSKTNAANDAATNANTKATEAEKVNASLSGTTLTVTNRNGQSTSTNLKGEQGTAAGFGTPEATIDNNVGTPTVTITASGSNTAKVFNFAFSNLKGEKGDGLNWGTMTEEDKEAVINSTAEKVEEDMVFASVQTCEDIIDELT